MKQYFVTVDRGVWDTIRNVYECTFLEEMNTLIKSWNTLAWSQKHSISKIIIEVGKISTEQNRILSKLNKKILERCFCEMDELEGIVTLNETPYKN